MRSSFTTLLLLAVAACTTKRSRASSVPVTHPASQQAVEAALPAYPTILAPTEIPRSLSSESTKDPESSQDQHAEGGP